MRSLPHPMRVVWHASLIVVMGSIAVLTIVAVGGGLRTDDGSRLLVALGWCVIVSFLVVCVTTRPALQQPPVIRMWPGSASVLIARPPEEVWAFIRPAETSSSMDPKVRRAFTVPGAPPGVGEQQCFISEGLLGQLKASVIEVVDEQPGRSATTRNVTGPPIDQHFDVAPSPGGSRLTYEVELSAARWSLHGTQARRRAATTTWEYVKEVKRVMESQPPGQSPGRQDADLAPADSTDPSSPPHDDST